MDPERRRDGKRFEALERALEIIRQLRKTVGKVRTRDRKLSEQIRDAASGVPIQLAEGRRRVGKDRLHLWRVALGSADEARTGLRTAEAWGYVEVSEVAVVCDELDQLVAMIWRMTN